MIWMTKFVEKSQMFPVLFLLRIVAHGQVPSLDGWHSNSILYSFLSIRNFESTHLSPQSLITFIDILRENCKNTVKYYNIERILFPT